MPKCMYSRTCMLKCTSTSPVHLFQSLLLANTLSSSQTQPQSSHHHYHNTTTAITNNYNKRQKFWYSLSARGWEGHNISCVLLRSPDLFTYSPTTVTTTTNNNIKKFFFPKLNRQTHHSTDQYVARMKIKNSYYFASYRVG